MSNKLIQAAVSVRRDADYVIQFVSDIHNRAKYLSSLKSATNVRGGPGEVTKSWNWRWEMWGEEFQGSGRLVAFQPGRLYAFVTEGGIESRFFYRAEPQEEETRLSIAVDLKVPAELADRKDLDGLLTVIGVRAQDSALRLKALAEQSMA